MEGDYRVFHPFLPPSLADNGKIRTNSKASNLKTSTHIGLNELKMKSYFFWNEEIQVIIAKWSQFSSEAVNWDLAEAGLKRWPEQWQRFGVSHGRGGCCRGNLSQLPESWHLIKIYWSGEKRRLPVLAEMHVSFRP